MARFLLVTHISPPAVDGGSRVIHKIGDYFRNSGHQVMTLSSNANSTDDFTRHYTPLKNHYLPVYTIFHRPLKLFSKVWSRGPIFKIIPFSIFLFKCIRYHPKYIIAGPLPTTIVLYANFIKKITGAKLVINASFHHTDLDFHQPTLIRALKSADIIWTLTKFETNYFHNHFGIPFSKMVLLGNGIDNSLLTSYRLPVTNYKLLYIGSFSAHKGITTLIDAFKLLDKKYTLTLAGQKTLYSPIVESKINSLSKSISSRININYNFKTSELANLLDNSSILISPSTQESFGLVLLEAMARGVPVIAADIPASIELIKQSQAGLIFKSGNTADLAQKIRTIKPCKYGITYASTHTWDKIGKSLWQKISLL